MHLSLYGYWRSSSTWRVRLALEVKSVGYEVRPVHMLEGGGQQHLASFQALNPMRQVPVLQVWEDEARTTPLRALGQSMAIMEFLEEQWPQPSILAKDPFDRALIRQLAEIVNSGIQPLQNLALIQHLRDDLSVDPAAFSRRWIERGLRGYQAALPAGGGRFSVGGAPTMADFCLIPQLYNARRFGVDLGPFDRLLEIEAAGQELEAFARAHPDAQPDAQGGA